MGFYANVNSHTYKCKCDLQYYAKYDQSFIFSTKCLVWLCNNLSLAHMEIIYKKITWK